MGNSHSSPSTRDETILKEPELNGGPAVTSPDHAHALTAPELPQAQTLAEGEKGDAAWQARGRRRSLINIPSLRRRSRNALSDDAPVVDSPSRLRRRWRAFGGSKGRTDTMAESSPPSIVPPPSQGAPTSQIGDEAPGRKGKEREAESMDREAVQLVESPEPELTAGLPGTSDLTVQDGGSTVSPETVLEELRELQDTMSASKDSQPNTPLDPQVGSDSDTRVHFDRPPTPIPTSVIYASPEPTGDVPRSSSHAALAEALGSWMGRRPRENSESTFDATGSRPPTEGPSGSQLPPSTTRASVYDDSDSLDAFARNSSRAASILGSPTRIPPAVSASGGRFGQNLPPAAMQHERHAPPAGTGTLVVVQGVVHTTDVRHPAYNPSRTQTTRIPRSTSSTPTLRASSSPTASQTPSRASTPQPSARRGRFSSLTSGLRPRSRPRTSSSLRSESLGAWRHSFAGVDSGNPSEVSPAPSEGPMRSSTSDLGTTSSSRSLGEPSNGASATRDDASVPVSAAEALHVDLQSDERATGNELPAWTERRSGVPHNSVHGSHQGGGSDVDGSSEDEGEAELSASSIEVLGTLLSVATAATAASLVTGTTDPLFSSGLAGPLTNANRNTTPITQLGSSTVPSPITRTSQPPLSPMTGTDNHNAEAVVNTRMRAAWESLRDRFSRTRGRRGASAPGGDGVDGRDDPREQMLTEMARAFNMGLGLDPDDHMDGRLDRRRDEPGEGTAVPDTSPSSYDATHLGGVSREASAPGGPGTGPGPEGSFERFLHNLQVDLRTALTEDYAARRARAQTRATRAAGTTSITSSNGEQPPGSPVLTRAASTGRSDSPSGSRSEQWDSPSPMEGTDVSSPGSALDPTIPHTPRAAHLDLPSLPGDGNARPLGSPGSSPPQAQGITGQPGINGINWWRLYRFPPMQMAPQPATPSNVGNSTTAGIPATQPQIPVEHSAASTSPHSLPPTGGNSPPESPTFLPSGEAAPGQNVVPVIVVGLQSVPVNRAGAQHQHNLHHGLPPTPITPAANGLPFEMDAPPDAPNRDRAWPLRAASRAFGRLGRRSDTDRLADAGTAPSAEHPSLDIPREGRHGGRTYLIFVIGGYYPPNHSIVTGADDMNSFEALWELAELLGQVKPPVASKEDIENSGLEIIKASSLLDYEKKGKVASNTVERCLICLDDYDHQDDLRLLSCRHIFHQQCVDKWLEQGRNNCPACRTKGVRTGDESLTSSMPSVS